MSWLWCSLVGAAAGVLASMGLGGGFVMVVYLALFTDIAQKNAQGINLLFFLPIIILSVIIHLKNRLVDFKAALVCGLVGAALAVPGFLLARALDNEWLRRAFAVFVIIAGLRDLFPRSIDKARARE